MGWGSFIGHQMTIIGIRKREIEFRFLFLLNRWEGEKEMYTIFCIIFTPIVIATAIKLALEMNGSGRSSGRGRSRSRRWLDLHGNGINDKITIFSTVLENRRFTIRYMLCYTNSRYIKKGRRKENLHVPNNQPQRNRC